MRMFEGLGQFARFLEAGAVKQAIAPKLMAEASAGVLYGRVRSIFGDASKLAELAPSTQTERERLGYTPNDPLLRNGELLRDSIEEGHADGIAAVGSSEIIALYHEYGYQARDGSHVPARPVFKIGLEESMPIVAEIAKTVLGSALGLQTTTVTLDDFKGDV